MRPIDRRLLERPAAEVAPRLLGAYLVSEAGDRAVTLRITEVEAYEGAADPASHAFRGPTGRTQVMFGAPGHLYCYFVYGMHWCANVVTGPSDVAGAVLVRAGQIIESVAVTAAPDTHRLASGPGRLTRALGIGAGHNGTDLLSTRSVIRLLSAEKSTEDTPYPQRYRTGPRVGVTAATEVPWRFWLDDERSVSAYRPGRRRVIAAVAPSAGQTGAP